MQKPEEFSTTTSKNWHTEIEKTIQIINAGESDEATTFHEVS